MQRLYPRSIKLIRQQYLLTGNADKGFGLWALGFGEEIFLHPFPLLGLIPHRLYSWGKIPI